MGFVPEEFEIQYRQNSPRNDRSGEFDFLAPANSGTQTRIDCIEMIPMVLVSDPPSLPAGGDLVWLGKIVSPFRLLYPKAGHKLKLYGSCQPGNRSLNVLSFQMQILNFRNYRR
jgi:hypothetical protein